ncbi:hypothetical protein M707_22565 [Arthrobacter sp. AK-YN10]|nr:Conserved hypothetical protein [Paenarthrobacter aurescens TC1]ERI35269.2 hypothetical protein M707_22565 [Arthrobacter sp. AK-YN10]
MELFRRSGLETHTTFLLGAGASVTSGLPGWDDFATRLLIQSGSVASPETAEILLARQDPLIAVEAARVSFGDRWQQKLRIALYEGVTSLKPSPLHLAVVGHFLSGDDADTSLATLNFDTLLEQAIERETGEEVISHVENATDHMQYRVHHLHGVITPQRADAVILTLTDFSDLIADTESWQLDYLESALDKGVLIIAGTSYRDPDVRQWLHAALRKKPLKHDAMVLLARQSFAVSKDQFAEIRSALSDQWRAVGLQPVLLEDHSDAAQIIRELRHVTLPSYLSPQQRSRLLWEAHTRRFQDLQSTHVDQLERDASTMREALDVDRLNLTLWLANGEGELVKWAAQDRVYRDLAALRTVSTGHDSEWIAGKALGVDEVLIQDLPDDPTRRWRSVLAAPIPVPHPDFPAHSAAVLTLGLPEEASRYDASSMMWAGSLAEIADQWGLELSAVAFDH